MAGDVKNSKVLGFNANGLQFKPGDVKARMQGIGGSEAYAAANILTPEMEGWATTQFELFYQKCGLLAVPDISDKASVQWGQWLEGPVIDKINKETKYKLSRDSKTHWSVDFPFLFAHIDAYLQGNVIEAFGKKYKRVIAEIKCPLTYSAKNYGEEGTNQVPTWTLMQCIHYLVVHTNVDAVFVFVQLPHEKLKHYVVKRDKKLIDTYIKAVCRFWSFVEEKRKNPDMSGGPDPRTSHDYTLVNWDHTEDYIADLDPEGEFAWKRMEERKVQAKIAELEDKKDRLLVLRSIGKAPGAILKDGRQLTAKRVVTRDYKEDKVKENFPEEYKKCQKFDRSKFKKDHDGLIDKICTYEKSIRLKAK